MDTKIRASSLQRHIPCHTRNVVIRDEHDRVMLKRLYYLNWAIGVLFFVVSACLALYIMMDPDAGIAPIYMVRWDRQANSGFTLHSSTVNSQVRFMFLPLVFTLLASVDHLFVCTVGQSMYERYLLKQQNPFRWIEYSLSASLMTVLISILCGILDVSLLCTVGALTTTCMFFGYIGDCVDPSLKRWVFWLGCIPFLAAWACIGIAFIGAALTSSVPGFVWAIVIVLFVLNCTFAFNQWWPHANYLHKEFIFILLSPTAKLALAGLTYGGLMAL